jgi:hypothetical protein
MWSLWMTAVWAVLAETRLQAEASTLDGRTTSGAVRALSAAGADLELAEGKAFLPADQLLRLRFTAAAPEAGRDASRGMAEAWLETVDGSRFAAAEFRREAERARWKWPSTGDEGACPSRSVASIVWQPLSAAAEQLWNDTAAKEVDGDLLVVNKREGTAADYVVGIVGEMRADSVDFQWDDERLAVARAKAAAIRFFRRDAEQLPRPVATLQLRDGSRFAVVDFRLADGRVTADVAAGFAVAVPAVAVEAIDFSQGKQQYLSDLDPALFAWTPLVGAASQLESLQRFGEYRRDASFAGTPLALPRRGSGTARPDDVESYPKGLAVRSRSELAYRIPEAMNRFRARIGIDPLTSRDGHVRLQISADEQVVWEGPISGSAEPAELDLELGAARRLRIVVDYGENLDVGDRVHFANARFTR